MKSNILVFRQREEDIKKDLRAILDKAAAESRGLNESEAASYEEKLKTLKAAVADVDRETALMEVERRTAASSNATQAEQIASRTPGAGFESLGDQLLAVRKAALSNGRLVDPRLFAGPAGASETAPADGGFLVQKDFAAELWQRAYDTGDVLSRCKKIPIGEKSNGVKINAIDEDSRADGSRWGGVLAYWANEAASATSSKPKFRQIELQLNKLIALVYATDELLEDGAALEAVVQESFTQEMTFRTEDAIFNGTGAGQPYGVLNAGALIQTDRATNGTIGTADILAMWSRLWGRSRKTAAWFVDQSIEPTLYPLTLGSPSLGQVLLFKPADRENSNQPWGSMMGAPVIPTEHGAALGTIGDIVLADMSQYLISDKGGVRQDYSIHVNFLTDEGVFRFVYRVDGQPAWKLPLTPKSGGPTQSAFVALSTEHT